MQHTPAPASSYCTRQAENKMIFNADGGGMRIYSPGMATFGYDRNQDGRPRDGSIMLHLALFSGPASGEGQKKRQRRGDLSCPFVP